MSKKQTNPDQIFYLTDEIIDGHILGNYRRTYPSVMTWTP